MNRTVILIDYPLYARAIAGLLEQEGFVVTMLASQEVSASRLQQLCAHKPAFVFTVNFSPELAFLIGTFDTPYVSWTIDPLPLARFQIFDGTRLDKIVAFAHSRATQAKLAAIGIPRVEYLPPAAPLESALEGKKLRPSKPSGMSFVGSSMKFEELQCLVRLEQMGIPKPVCEHISQWLTSLVLTVADHADYPGVTLGDLERFLEMPLGDIFDQEMIHFLNDVVSARLRIHRVGACSEMGLRIFGDDGWKAFPWYVGRTPHGEDLGEVYASSVINLEVPRVNHRHMASLRAFDVMLSGGLLLSETSRELGELFVDGDQMVTYRDAKDLVRVATELVRDEAEAKKIAERGKAEVMRHHLLRNRVQKILSSLSFH